MTLQIDLYNQCWGPKTRDFPGKTRVSARNGAWDLTSHFASVRLIATIADATPFKRGSYASEAITALGNRALGETYVDFVFRKISGKSCRAGLDTVVALDLRKGYVGAWRASRRHEPYPCRRGPLRSRRNAGGGGDGRGLPPPSRTESAAAICVGVGAPQPPFASRGAEIRGK
jgi:hypothetical protein